MPPKYASPYSLVKTPLEQTKFYSLFDARNKERNQIWHARVIHHEAIQKLGLTEHIAYNEEALLNLKEKEYVIYVKEIFVKNGDSFFIEEKYENKLSTYLEKKGTLEATEVEKIIKDVFKGLCDIYEQGYVHRNIRPEHIVFVPGQTKDKGLWKIETLVLDNQQFAVDTPFTWKKSSASPEERNQKDELDEEMLDAQIVWNFGYLSMHLLHGNEFINKRINKDNDIQWIKIKEMCSKTPALYELIEKCFRLKFNDRVSLKKFFNLQIFSDCERQSCSEYFLTASKIFKTKTFSSISLNMRSMNMKSMNLNMKSKMLKSPSPVSPKNASINKIIQQPSEYEDQINPIRGSLLSGISKYLSFIEMNEPPNRSNQNKSIIEFYFIKLSLMFLDKSPNTSIISSRLKEEGQSIVNSKSKIIKRIKHTENFLLKQFNIDSKQNYALPQLIQIFNKLCGYAYSRVRDSCEKNEKMDSIKALAYFGLTAVIVNTNDCNKIKSIFNIKRGQTYMQAFQQANSEVLIKQSQELIVRYFKTDN